MTDMQTLTHHITLYVPSTVGDRPSTEAEFLRRTEDASRWLAVRAGGATVTAGRGAYVMDDGTLVQEEVALVTAYVAENDYQWLVSQTLAYAERMKEEWGQEAVSVEADGYLTLV